MNLPSCCTTGPKRDGGVLSINSHHTSECVISVDLFTLHWRYNDQDGVSNHQPHGCLLNRLFRRRSKKTSKLRVTGLRVRNPPGPVNSPHKGPVTRIMFPFDDVIMMFLFLLAWTNSPVDNDIRLHNAHAMRQSKRLLPLILHILKSTWSKFKLKFLGWNIITNSSCQHLFIT